MVADDALNAAEAWDLVGNVGFQIDPVEAADNRLPQQQQAGILRPGPAARRR
jgi:hypothetical protein